MRILSLRILILFLLIVNCGVRDRFIFSPSVSTEPENKIAKTIAIEEFKDFRDSEEENLVGYSLIPFYFYEIDKSNQDQFNKFAYNKTNIVIPLAIRKEIQTYNRFQDVYFQTESDSKDSDYIIQGKLLKTEVKKAITVYGLSIFGVYLSLLGLPMTYTEIDVEFEISLLERKSNRILVSRRYEGKKDYLGNLYTQHYLIDANSLLDKIIKSFAKDCIDVLSK